jgi:hypothetical protein
MKFSPCRGGDSCTQGGTHCEGCGRSHEEIAETRELVDAVAAYAVKKGFENIDEFAQFVAMRAAGKARMMQS